MAGEYVTEEQFDEFVKRMEQAFAHMNQRLDDQQQSFNQRLDSVENRMEQGFHLHSHGYTPVAQLVGPALRSGCLWPGLLRLHRRDDPDAVQGAAFR